jgi:hypothetical protein
MFEFDTTFNVNTGELDFSYIGSGVHLYKDVTFAFSLIDPMGNIIENDAALISNPLIDSVIFDIMDTGRNIIFPTYRSGTTSRSITITEYDNESIFGQYNPNFGVRVTLTNKIGADPFVSEFYAYANTPSISNIIVSDASGKNNYNQSGFWKFNLIPSLLTGMFLGTQSSGNVNINWGNDPYDIVEDTVYITGEYDSIYSSGDNFSILNSNLVIANISGHNFESGAVVTISGITGTGVNELATGFNGVFPLINITRDQFQYYIPNTGTAIGSGIADIKLTKGAYNYNDIITDRIYDKIILENTFNNDLKYLNIERYDIYASAISFDDIKLPESTYINKTDNPNFVYSYEARTLEDIYKLKILPVSLSYDVPYYFKVVPYSSIGSGDAILFGPNVFKQEAVVETGAETVFNTNQINLNHGESSMNLDFITGQINTSGIHAIDIIERGIYNTISYTTQITDKNNTVYSSEIKIVDTNNSTIGSGISFSEYSISDNSYVTYSATGDQSYIYLYVSGVKPTGIYKLYKTSI